MTTKELEHQIIAVKQAQRLLADTYKKIDKSIQKIEQIAKENEGELTEEQAENHTVLNKYKDKIVIEVVATINYY